MYRIGLFSKINRVTVKTLRYYDDAGLLKPSFVDRDNGYRYYTSDQLPRLQRIIALRQIGFSIDEISAILSGHDVVGIFQQRKAELEAFINESMQQITQIMHYLENMKEDFNMSYEIAIKELPEVIVYSMKTTIPNYDYYFELIPKIGEEIKEANPDLQCVVPEYCFIKYLDGEYKDKDIEIEFCEAVTEMGVDTERLKFKKIDRVPAAACLYHKGPYRTIRSSYALLFKWIFDNGYVSSDCPRESYIDGIWNKEDENEWLTEIQVPISKK
jgi:DNA-binding transcriptional MerR regulator